MDLLYWNLYKSAQSFIILFNLLPNKKINSSLLSIIFLTTYMILDFSRTFTSPIAILKRSNFVLKVFPKFTITSNPNK